MLELPFGKKEKLSLNLYYIIRPLIPRRLQIFLRRIIARRKRIKHSNIWPIDVSAGLIPEGWRGWPDGKKFALVLSHDVDTQKGHDHVRELLKIEKEIGLRSAYNFVPERYNLSTELIREIKAEGFEVNIHGLKHDGKLFNSRAIFEERALKINQYIQDWQIDGFTAPSMICNLDWIHGLNITHSTCTFDTDPFEPQPNPSKTIFPFIVKDARTGHEFVELPYTLPQDHALFIILQEKDNTIWREKLAWIAERGGMALLNTHPDYMHFPGTKATFENYPFQLYVDFLNHVRTVYEGQFWHALPSEVATYVHSCRRRQP